METYKIVRFHREKARDKKVIKRGLTLAEAQRHCQDEATHKKDDNGNVVWFDGYEKE